MTTNTVDSRAKTVNLTFVSFVICTGCQSYREWDRLDGGNHAVRNLQSISIVIFERDNIGAASHGYQNVSAALRDFGNATTGDLN